VTRPLRLAVLGDPVEHSRSPAMHTAALQAAGLAGTYTARRVDAEGLRAAAEEVRRGELDGANITMPHKRLAAELSDDLDPAAARARSVNTWILEGRGLVGFSTDVDGIRAAWARRGLPDGPVMILGSGGAAAAALIALEGRPLRICARRIDAAAELVAATGVEARVEAWTTPADGETVVNATPIGMNGEHLPEGVLDAVTALFEMAYGPAVTPAVEFVGSRHLPVADGIDLLVAQAEASFRLWTGRIPAAGIMEAAARNRSSAHRAPPTLDSEREG
jgi:shikimate dehydrogenase